MMLSGKHLLFLMLVTALSSASADPIVAKAIVVQNKVILESSNASLVEVKRGSTLSLGDTIRTHDNARAIFRFNDGTTLTLGSQSEIKIQTFSASQQDKKGVFDFVKGALRIVTGAITKTGKPDFTVKTPMGSIGIRGTDFWAGNLNNHASMDVLLIKSEHALHISNPLGQVQLNKDLQGTTLNPNQAPLSPRMWPEEKIQRAFNTVSIPE